MSTTMTSSIIEATSLQHVTDLAANPPSNPNSQLPANTPPLVLYIARVPGSRDVFLTPVKPREKVVTAEDVQSSLYYLHINGPEDYENADDSVVDRPAPSLQGSSRPTSVNTHSTNLPSVPQRPARKKIPPPLPKRLEARSAVSAPPYPVDDGMMPRIVERPPSPPPHRQPGKQQNGKVHPPAVPARRPLPDAPAEAHDVESATLHAENIRLLRHSSLEDAHDNPYIRSYSSHPETVAAQQREQRELQRELDLNTRPEAGTLTLIRRNPGSGEQWNVASIHDPPVEEVSSSSLLVPTANRRTKRGGAPLYLDVTNPGYTQFSHVQQTESRLSTPSTASSAESDPPPDGTFRRRLYMPGTRFSEHEYTNGHRKHFSLSSASGTNDLTRKTMRSDRHHSVDIVSLSSAPPGVDRRSKGYTFTSPWNGHCEFSTGTTGRSLKCRHHLPGAGATEVSELRFNLPTKSRPPVLTSKSSSSLLPHRALRHLRQDSFDSSSDLSSPGMLLTEDGRISLELGQERAGGGFGGKQAKLGKLIVWPEGCRMLDLLVAANVGLWWRAWERAGGG